MKTFRTIVLLLVIVTLLCISALAADSFAVQVYQPGGGYQEQTATAVSLLHNGQPMQTDVPAFILDDRTMVPVRVISEALEAQVNWLPDTLQVQILYGEQELLLTIGSAEALVDGVPVALYDGVPATLVKLNGSSRTMVPVRFVTEQLGADVLWDGETYTVSIQTVSQEPLSQIGEIEVDDGQITLSVDGKAEPVIFSLPDRTVIDFPGAVLTGASSGTVTVDGSAIQQIRFNQYDTGYDGYARVVRIVLDMQSGMTREDLDITVEDGMLYVKQPEGSTVLPPETIPELPAQTYTVVLDAGHGGSDPGAQYNGIDEKDLALSITEMTGELLSARGVEVIYTRDEDVYVTLAGRADLANTLEADLFISIHANAIENRPEICGLETYYLVGGEAAQELAATVHACVLEMTGAVDRHTRTANYYVLRYTDMPAILVETGYMTNETELLTLSDPAYQALLAQGICDGICAYLGLP